MLCPSSPKTDVISNTLLTPRLFSQAQLHGKPFTAETDARVQKVKMRAEEHQSLMVCTSILLYLSTLWCCLHQTLGCTLLKMLYCPCFAQLNIHNLFAHVCLQQKHTTPSHNSVVETKPQIDT